MLELLLLLFLFIFNFKILIYLFLLLMMFLLIKNYYTGMFFLSMNNFFIFLIFMSILILLLIFLTELNYNLKLLSFFLIFISLIFFISLNIFYIYIFFELSLFPIIIMILGYGYQIEKINSSYYLFFFTLICSMPFFFFIFNLDLVKSMNYFNLFFSWELSLVISLMFLLKFPIYFLHYWLPKAHVEAPTTASMLLAGLLLKMGTGGFLRFLNSFNFYFLGVYFFISFIGMILSNFNCIIQSDLKALAAFSSINHMSFVLLSMVFLNKISLVSSVIIMFSHGLISTLMFFFIGEFYHYANNRLIYYYSSVFLNSLFFCFLVSLTWLYNGGVPFSLSFFSEFMSFVILFNYNLFYMFFGSLYFFISFYYCLFFISLNFVGKNYFKINLNLNNFTSFFIICNSNIFFFIFLI